MTAPYRSRPPPPPDRPRLGYSPTYDPPEYGRDASPGVIIWFRVYALSMALLYFFVIGFGVILSLAASQPGVRDAAANQGVALVVILLGVVLSVFHVVAAFAPRKPWGWAIGMVAICLGLTGGCTLVACVPLLLYWIKPEAKAAFGRLPI